MVANSKHLKEKKHDLSELDKEKEYLKGCLKTAKSKRDRTAIDSMMRIFWDKEVKRIEKKIGR